MDWNLIGRWKQQINHTSRISAREPRAASRDPASPLDLSGRVGADRSERKPQAN